MEAIQRAGSRALAVEKRPRSGRFEKNSGLPYRFPWGHGDRFAGVVGLETKFSFSRIPSVEQPVRGKPRSGARIQPMAQAMGYHRIKIGEPRRGERAATTDLTETHAPRN